MAPREVWVRALGVLLIGVGCYDPPDLPPIGEVPIVPRPFVPCDEPDEEARVACVIDGDTLDLNACGADVGERVRLLGIDAPETEKDDTPAECFANEAFAFLRDLVDNQQITMSHDTSCVGAFGRTLGYIWLRGEALEEARRDPDVDAFTWAWYLQPEEPAILVNELLLGLGYVRDFPEEIGGTLAFQNRLDRARIEAQTAGRGLWGACEGAE